MQCVTCKQEGGVALACMHVVHAACFKTTCPVCDNQACDLATALEVNQLALPGRHAHFKRLPESSRRLDETTLLNTYSPFTHGMHSEAEGAWILAMHRSTLEVWYLREAVAVHWMGSVAAGVDSFHSTAQRAGAGTDALDDLCLVQAGRMVEAVKSQT